MQNDCFFDATPDWQKHPISFVAEINPRYPLKKGELYPFVEMAAVAEQFGGIQGFDQRKMEGSGLARYRAGDTLFAKITPCPENGKVAHVGFLPAEYGLGSTEFIVLSPKPECDPRFLYHLACCHAVRGRAASRMEGSTGRQRVPDDVFQTRLLVPIPSKDEQIAIATVLDAVGLVIQRISAAIEQNRTFRKSLLSALLGNGIGGGGRVRSFKESPADFIRTRLGRLPSEWRMSTVGQEFELQNGFTLNAERRPRFRKRRYLRVANVQRDGLNLQDIKELEARDAEFAPRTLRESDLLVVEGHADRMQIGRCARVSMEAEGMTFQNHLFRLRTRGDVLPYFGCLWLNSEYAQRYWNARCATSSGLNTINQRTLRRLLVPVPSVMEQGLIENIVRSQRAQHDALVAKHHKFVELQKALMGDLLAGHVRTGGIHIEDIRVA